MKIFLRLAAISALLPAIAGAADDKTADFNFADNWPTHLVFGDGTDLGLSLKYQYDLNRFSNDGDRLEDSQTNRRKELGFYVKKKGIYDLVVVYDFQAKVWLDTALRLQSKGLTGHDIGAFRIGYSKTPLGFEGNTSTGATTFLEAALPTQAIYASRRLGVDWLFERKHIVVDAGIYSGGDLNGDSDGQMQAVRAAWVPFNEPGAVLHLGVSVSRESPDGSRDGRGIYHPASARIRARPEAALAPRLVDSGALVDTDRIDRHGLEAVWIAGPWSLQGEYLSTSVARVGGLPDYDARGYYAFGSWIITGESRGYSGGNVGNVKPKGKWGAVELALRYSRLDLDDAPLLGGTERNWTFGANWYLNRYLKLQGNYVRARSQRRGVVLDPHIVEMRAQIQF